MGCHPRKYKSSPKSHPRTLPSIMPVQDFCLFFEEGDHIWFGLSISIYVSGCWGMLAKDKTSSAHFPSVALCHSIRAGNSLLCYWVNLTLAWIRERTPRVKHISLCQLFGIRQQRRAAKWPPSGSDMCWHHVTYKGKQWEPFQGKWGVGLVARMEKVKGGSSERRVFFGAC